MLNQGIAAPGVLSSPKSYPGPASGLEVLQVNTGDFNGDGKQDIIAGAVFYGNGDGTLQTPVQTSATGSYVVGDFNNDGCTDIAYLVTSGTVGTSTATAALQILLGSTSGQLATGTNLPLPSADATLIVPFQNMATSNIVNLAIVSGASTVIALGNGTGGFALGQTYGVAGSPVIAQTGSTGDTNLLFGQTSQSVLISGNGDGTFQAPPATALGQSASLATVIADINGDGLTDVLSINAAGNLVAALGRGNGRFSIASETAGTGQLVTTGDFNGNGNVDAVTIYPGETNLDDGSVVAAAQIFFYSGNGDGTFQPSLPAVALSVAGVETALVGDFNGDSNLDLVISYSQNWKYGTVTSGVLFLAGNGDGTFKAPVSLSLPATSIGMIADLRNNNTLDIVGGNTVALGNGKGPSHKYH